MTKGKYIVLEGIQGIGKTTQIKLLAKHLQAVGLPVRMFREPDSQSDLTARVIRQLTQDPQYPMNTRTEVLLYNAARSQSLQVIRKSIEQGIICLVDRNYLTNLAIQYYGRGDVADYEAINRIISFAVGDMEPDLTLVLDAPVETMLERYRARNKGERFDNLDESFLQRVRNGYLKEANVRSLPIISAIGTPEEVLTRVWKYVAVCLSSRTVVKKHDTAAAVSTQTSPVEKEAAPLLQKTPNQPPVITEAGHDVLSQAVTNTTANVYAFTEHFSPVTIAAAMARLSRRGDDMRVTLLDEFAGKAGKDESLLQRVITAYGDDSVQQLTGLHVVVENASNILTKKLQWGRLASYLEQSTRYIYFDQKDAQGRYRFYTPTDLSPELITQYESVMTVLFDKYSQLVRQVTEYIRANSSEPKEQRDAAWLSATKAQACDAVRPVLPVAVTSTVGIFASGQALESLIMHLLSDEMSESVTVGEQLLAEARKVIPTFLERADKPERGGAWVAYRANTRRAMHSIARQNLPESYGASSEPVKLDSFWPRNELDLLPDMLYEHSNLSLQEIRQAVATWPYEKREKAFKTYMGERLNRRHKPGRAIEKAHYSWDLLCDYGIFRDLQRHRMVDDLEWQTLTPRYGYDMPAVIEDAGLADLFEECFDISVKLYSDMQAAGYEKQAQYATLLGHRMRWKVTYNAREAFHLHELRTSPQGHPGYRKLVQSMHEKLAEVHPLLAESMKFVNQGEDPALTRLAAERYTQFKNQQQQQTENAG